MQTFIFAFGAFCPLHLYYPSDPRENQKQARLSTLFTLSALSTLSTLSISILSTLSNIYTVIPRRYVSQLGEGRDCKRKWHDLSQSDTSNTESDTEFEEPELRLEVNILVY